MTPATSSDVTSGPPARRVEEAPGLGDGGHGHGLGHGHGAAVGRAPRRTRVVLACLLLPALVATALGMWALWPAEDDVPERIPVVVENSTFADVTVAGPPAEGDDGTTVPVELADGETSRMQADPRFGLEEGDEVVALLIGDLELQGVPAPYVFMEHQRELPLGILACAYALVVLLVARWRGLAAMAGLGVAFAVFLGFTFPALLAGKDAMPVALVTSSAVMLVVLYLAHGFTVRTSVALLGTLAGLGLTAAIGAWATAASHLSGATSETAQTLPSMAPGVDLQGIVLCGLVLAGMGVLNDVTITQASAVWELRALAPLASRRALFARAMRIGRDHIASTVYTIAFAYVGAALPLLLTVWLLDQSPTAALTSGEIAEEIVRTLVGSIGLVLAIPITTAIAAVVVPSAPARSAEAEPARVEEATVGCAPAEGVR